MKQLFDVVALATSRFSPAASVSIAAVAPMRKADQRADHEQPAVVCPWCDKEPLVDHGLRPAQAALGVCIWACGARPRWPSSCWRTRPTCLSTAAATRTASRTTTTGALQRSPLRFRCQTRMPKHASSAWQPTGGPACSHTCAFQAVVCQRVSHVLTAFGERVLCVPCVRC